MHVLSTFGDRSLFFCLGFLSRTFTIRRTAKTGGGGRGGYFINSSLPLTEASPKVELSVFVNQVTGKEFPLDSSLSGLPVKSGDISIICHYVPMTSHHLGRGTPLDPSLRGASAVHIWWP